MKQFTHDELDVFVGATTGDMARRAAADAAACLRTLLAQKDEVNVIIAGGESQQAFHAALIEEPEVDWARVNGLSVDDFYAPGMDASCSVRAQLGRDLYPHLALKSVQAPDYAAPDAEAERRRYEELLEQYPPDVAFLGIGRSGHVAFNEPGDTDFDDPQKVRLVDICEASRRQLEEDPNFMVLDEIPRRGITITMPTLINCPHLFVVVPLASKAPIVKRLFESAVSPDLPATRLKSRPGTRLYLDAGSYSLCEEAAPV